MRLFVTGTDTDVGKTVVTAALACAARDRGTVLAVKPVASGVAPGTAGDDAERIARAAGHAPLSFATYAAPLSPHRAALLEGRDAPVDLLRQIASLAADTVLVEGVGGWRVPLSSTPPIWVADLAAATGPDVVVVAADRLGTINHTLLTLEAIAASGGRVALLVLNRAHTADGSRAYNEADLRALVRCPLVTLDRIDVDDVGALRDAGAELWAALHG